MTGHPAVENGALALLLGWDPVRYGRAEGVERLYADAVLSRAAEMRAQEMEAQARLTAAAVAQLFG